jgi:DNA-binding response OmpR family regulator
MPIILIVEDDRMLGASIDRGLRESGFETRLAASLAQASAALSRGLPDLVVLDLGLPDGEGIQFLQRLRLDHPRLPAIITTARSALERRLDAFDAGADDYLVKPFAFAELLARIRIQLRHAQPEPTTALRVGDLELDMLTRSARRGGAPLELTPREFELLVYLAAAGGGVVTRETLACEVWKARSWTPSLDNAIGVHISRLRDKLDKGRDARLLHTVRGTGYALREQA